MGNNLADFIERFILGKFIDSQAEHILMRRNDLAVELSCAPSQISYVLSTRFTPERGFVVESRRGAGGFVRIIRIVPAAMPEESPREKALELLQRLSQGKVISRREHALLMYFLEFSGVYLDDEGQFALLRQALHRMSQNT